MNNLDKLTEFAPVIVVILLFFLQNKFFVKPEEIEKKHRDILDDVQKKYVELNAYKEFQNYVVKEFATVKHDMNKGFDDINKKFDKKFDEIKEILTKQRKDDV